MAVLVVAGKAMIVRIVLARKRTRFGTVQRRNRLKGKEMKKQLSNNFKTPVDTVTTEVSSYATGSSFQHNVDWKQWSDVMDCFHFLNVHVAVNCVHI